MATGYLVVVTTTATGLQQLPDAFVIITKPDSTFRITVESGVNGRTKEIELETVDKAYSLDYQSQQLPFQRYYVEVKHTGYNTSSNHIVDIFDGVVSTLNVSLVPAKSQVDMPAQNKAIAVVAEVKQSAPQPALNNLNNNITIPQTIKVKLGSPDSDAPVVQLDFIDYVKNVVSQLVYPTWPEDAIKTVIFAVISNGLRRIITKYYEKLGYPFQITADGYFDQPYSSNRSIPIKISQYVDEMFNEFVTTSDLQMPIGFVFSPYHDQKHHLLTDGVKYMDFWQVVYLANQGLNPLEIIRALYGDQFILPECADLEGISEVYPGRRLKIGSTGKSVALMQHYLNVIAEQYPTVLPIPNRNGVFDEAMRRTVEEVQNLFFLEPTGVIDKPTWYRIIYLYNRLKDFRELQIIQYQMSNDDWSFPGELKEGDHRYAVYQLQFMLNVIKLFIQAIPNIPMDGRFQKDTKEAVMSFQKLYGMPITGIVDQATWQMIYEIYARDTAVLPSRNDVREYPEAPLSINSDKQDVMAVQSYLNRIAQKSLDMDTIEVNGIYDEATKDLVRKFQEKNRLPITGVIHKADWDAIVFQCIQCEKGKFYPNMQLRYLMKNNYVSMVQQHLRACHPAYHSIPIVEESGVFDESTVIATKEFQRLFGLPQTGEVDKATWHLLMQVSNLSCQKSQWSALCGNIIDYFDNVFINHKQKK